jgi:DNA-binding NarL/FixJ family response regulator
MKLGRTNRQIPGALVISLGTAKNHVEHITSQSWGSPIGPGP